MTSSALDFVTSCVQVIMLTILAIFQCTVQKACGEKGTQIQDLCNKGRNGKWKDVLYGSVFSGVL